MLLTIFAPPARTRQMLLTNMVTRSIHDSDRSVRAQPPLEVRSAILIQRHIRRCKVRQRAKVLIEHHAKGLIEQACTPSTADPTEELSRFTL